MWHVLKGFHYLEDHVPAKGEVAGRGERGALVVHLDGELLHLALQARAAVHRRHLADGHERLAGLEGEIRTLSAWTKQSFKGRNLTSFRNTILEAGRGTK